MNIKHSKPCSTIKPAVDDKYIIELAETYELASIGNSEASPSKLYRVKGFNSLVFDENGLSKLKKYEPTPVIDVESIRTEAVNKLYRAFSVAAGMNSQQLKECFFDGEGDDNITLSDVLATVSPETFIECIESRIVPGDEVSVLSTALFGTVLSVDTGNDSIAVLFPDNIVRTYCAAELTKTGNHVNISITTATDTPEQTVTIY